MHKYAGRYEKGGVERGGAYGEYKRKQKILKSRCHYCVEKSDVVSRGHFVIKNFRNGKYRKKRQKTRDKAYSDKPSED
jgi:hypothetical protein